jgi:hypothetical protein
MPYSQPKNLPTSPRLSVPGRGPAQIPRWVIYSGQRQRGNRHTHTLSDQNEKDKENVVFYLLSPSSSCSCSFIHSFIHFFYSLHSLHPSVHPFVVSLLLFFSSLCILHFTFSDPTLPSDRTNSSTDQLTTYPPLFSIHRSFSFFSTFILLLLSSVRPVHVINEHSQ